MKGKRKKGKVTRQQKTEETGEHETEQLRQQRREENGVWSVKVKRVSENAVKNRESEITEKERENAEAGK